MSSVDDDGRLFAQYAEDHCVCAYCWSPLTQVWDDEARQWVARCTANPDHVGTHHQAFRDSEINRHATGVVEIAEFYRSSEYAAEFGLAPRLTGESLQEKFRSNRRALRRDDSGLF